MDFRLQLRMLLWKNYTLKKRRPFVVAFEVLIPLVLFMVLMGIRLRREPQAVEENVFSVKALPSAGIIPLLQMFCPNKTQNEHGFPIFPESRTDELLNNLTIILHNVDKNHGEYSPLFEDNQVDYDEITKELFDNQSYSTRTIKDFVLKDIWKDPDNVKNFMEKNLSIPEDLAESFLNATVNGSEVLRLLDKSASDENRGPKFQKRFDTLRKRLFFQSLINPKLMTDQQALRKVILRTMYPKAISGPDGVKSSLQNTFLSPESLRNISCNSTQFKMLITMPRASPEQQDELQHRLCNMTDKQFSSFSREISEQLNTTTIYDKLAQSFVSPMESPKYQKQIAALRKHMKLLKENEEVVQAATGIARLLQLNESLGDQFSDENGKGNENVRFAKKIWTILGPVLCGPNKNEYEKDPCPDAMYSHLSNSKALEVMLYLMTNNPLIVYSPNGTEVDEVVKRANWTFQAVADSIKAGHWWLGYSRKFQVLLSSKNFTMEFLDMFHFLKAAGVRDSLTSDQKELFDLEDSLVSNFNPGETRKKLKFADHVVNEWLRRVENISLDVFMGFNNSRHLENFVMNHSGSPQYRDSKVIAGIVFTNVLADGKLPPHVEYKIRMNSTFTPDTTTIRSNYWQPGPECDVQLYYFLGFDWFQDIFDRAIIDQVAGVGTNLAPASYLQEIPYPCYMSDSFMFVIKHMVPLCMVISWIYTVAITVQSIVYEKERRLKEFMKMMGLSNIVHWIAWFINSLCTISITVALLTIVLKYGKILTYSNPLIVWLFLMEFAVATIVFCFLISVFFSKAKLAAACGGIIYFLTYMPFVFISIREDAAKESIGSVSKSFASLFSTTAFGLASRYFALYEEQSIGVQWSNIGKSPLAGDDFNILKICYMLILDTILYAILVWYIEAVHPGSYGLPRPWYFPLQATYWFGHNTRACSKLTRNYVMANDDDASACSSGLLACEREPVHLPLGVVIEGLVKVYKTGMKRAVNQLSLNLFEGQITSFLGHNGAGKTTTMSLLTGLFPPTQGTAYIYDNDIRYDMDDIRKSLGFCPQHNVLFDRLTVEEHLWFYARLKGMPSNLVLGEVDRLVLDLDLPSKRHSLVDTLSGGMKRKLSIAVAFVAKSRMVILDEPTAGVDPYARRAIWDLLIKYKQDRTILLSTHFMDEADVLGDRIAIISEGKLRCLGSSLFLKSHFGDGYNLTLVKKSSGSSHSSFTNTPRGSVSNLGGTTPTEGSLSVSLGSSPGTSIASPVIGKLTKQSMSRGSNLSICEASAESVCKFVQSYIPSAKLVQDSRQQLSFMLPNNVVKKDGFGNFFAHLEEKLDALGLKSFGITETPLEEVFLKVTDIAGQDDSGSVSLSSRDDSNRGDESEEEDVATPLGNGSVATPLGNGSVATPLGNGSVATPLGNGSVAAPLGNGSLAADQSREMEMMDVAGADTNVSITLEDEPLLSVAAAADDDDEKPKQEVLVKNNSSGIHANGNSPLANGVCDNVTRNDVSTAHGVAESADPEDSSRGGSGSYVVTGAPLKWQQFCGLILKRFYQTRRNLKGLFSQVFLPSFFITIAMVFALSVPSPKDAPPLLLNTAMFDRPNYVPFANEAGRSADRGNRELACGIEGTLKLRSGVGSFCVVKNSTHKMAERERQPYSCIFQRKKLQKQLEKLFNEECANAVYKISDIYLCGNGSTDPSTEHRRDERRGCHCSSYNTEYVCSGNVAHFTPKALLPATIDTLRNVTGRNVSKYLLYTTKETRMKRYGGLVFGEIVPSVPAKFSNFSCSNINCDTIQRLGIKKAVKALYNNKGYHSQPVFLNIMDNAILRNYLPSWKGNPAAYGISVTNHPFNKTGERLSEEYRRSGTNVVIAIFVIVAMSFVPAAFVVFLVTERSTNSKHLQFVCGVDPTIYWLSNYFWDMLNYLIPAAVCITILYSFQVPAYASPSNFPAVVCLFLFYGWSVTPLMYPASFYFKVPSTAYVVMIVTNLFLGITSTVSTSILEIFIDDEVLKLINRVISWVFLFIPNYCLGRGLMNLAYNEYKGEFKRKVGESYVHSPFEWDIVTRNLVFMAAEGFAFFLLTLLIEHGFFSKENNLPSPSSELEDDEDVSEERERVLSGDADDNLVCLKNLTKVYFSSKTGNHLAVDRLCLGIRQGECFGLLGVNGAGKTSTFKMLTGDTSVTSGEAFLNSYSVRKEILKVHRCIGYCPQFDALIDEMTAREHLMLYARLRGVPIKELKLVVDWAIKKLNLSRFADKPSKTFSGGMKRKLSTAIALIGDPSVIFLDEPTTGMDPKARRFLWDTVIGIVQDGRSVVLTSHSMEECEALCTRLAIMVNGRFKCLGSTQHLKNRFGNGYIITLRIKGENPDLESVISFFNENFRNILLKEKHHNMLQYQLPSGIMKLSEVFERIENHLDILKIEDYSVSQTTLDNVFINFAKQQTDDVEFTDKTDNRDYLHRLCVKMGLLKSRRLRRLRGDDSCVRFTSLNETNDMDDFEVTFSSNSQLSFTPEVNA